MRKSVTIALAISLLVVPLSAQTLQQPNSHQQQPPPPPSQQQIAPEDTLRITTQLVQTDVVVTGKNEEIVRDLKLSDFEVFENGKKQDLQFMEFISVDDPGRAEGSANVVRVAPKIDTAVATDTTAPDLRRVIGFVVDDVTIPPVDVLRVREMLIDFVDNKMRNGDLVAIVRTVGGRGLLEQFTSDRQILKRAISQLGVRSLPPHLAFNEKDPARQTLDPVRFGAPSDDSFLGTNNNILESPPERINQVPRAVLALSVANQVVDSLRQVPGRKNLILLSGGLPMFGVTERGSIIDDITQLFRMLTDNATRSGVVVNTMDVRGLKTTGAVASFGDTPGKSALGGQTLAGEDERRGFGRTMDTSRLGDESLTAQLTLRVLASMTGGVSVVNTNNFPEGLDRVLKRSRGYYRLAYRPSEKFDNTFHKVEVKVRRGSVNVYHGEGYVAREDRGKAAVTKEDQIVNAAISPLSKRDLDVAAELQYTFTANNQADLTINAFINPRKLQFKRVGEKYHASFDVVGFVFDQIGRSRGGISQTVNAELTEEGYKRAFAAGLGYSASTQIPPGIYQVRLVIHENETGKLGTVSRYFEVPDLSQKRLTMSSILLYEVSPTATDKTPEQLAANRTISRKQDLRYASVIYNARSDSGKPQVMSRLMISVGDKILFQEPEQRLEKPGTSPGQLVRVGQLALAKVPPGRYVLTLVVTDPLADKDRQTISRSVDFTVVE